MNPEAKQAAEHKWHFEIASGILDHENKYVGAYGRRLVDTHNAAIVAATAKLREELEWFQQQLKASNKWSSHLQEQLAHQQPSAPTPDVEKR